MSPKLKSFIQYSVITLIGVFFLFFVFKGTDWNDLMDKFSKTNYWWISAGMLISIFSHFLRGYRATMFYDALNYKVPVKNSFYAVMIGYMMNYIIPRAGEVSRCAALVKTDDIPLNKSLGTVVTERIFDMIILLLIIAIVFVMQFNMLKDFMQKIFASPQTSTSSESILKYIVIGSIILFGVVIYVLRKKIASHPLFNKIVNLLKGFVEGLMSIKQVKNPVLFIFLSFAIWFCYILMMYFCLFATKATEHLSFINCLTVFAIGSIGMIIPAPGAGAGTYHFAIMSSLLLFGVPKEDGIAYATIVHGIQMILLLLIGAICSLLVLAMHKKKLA